MELCTFHPDHPAVERCEVCQRPLCGLCLWYSHDGLRLCEEHAQERVAAGEQVLPPATYAEAIGSSVVHQPPSVSSSNEGEGSTRPVNNQDLTALVGAIIALTTLASCMGGAYCLPIVAVALGAAAYRSAHLAADPRRTRQWAGVGMGVGGLMLLFLLVYVLCFVLFFVTIFASALAAGRP
ncbi:MAG: B-box zinc finger protein [Chloroflexota bacterium]